ncbi:MAG: helix-turn-helix domain-containing protein [Tannerella sp.]|nr:helix-turn-helix domain-containing protein [Tannerella sp.]
MINYKNEHLNCINYKSDDSYGFKYLKVSEGSSVDFSDKYNYLVFLLKGNMHFHTAEVADRKLSGGEILLLPKGSVYSHEVRQDSELVYFSFSMLASVCDKLYIQQTLSSKETIEPMSIVPIRFPMDNFLNTIVFYLNEGLNCEHLHQLKEKEMFLLFRGFYMKKELTKLFHEIAGESDFRSIIMQNYLKVRNVGELASLANMGRTTFDCKFKSVFGTSARQWMLSQLAKHVKMKAMDPDVTISDLMAEFHFNSATHFNWFCRKQFKCTPLELIHSVRRNYKPERSVRHS